MCRATTDRGGPRRCPYHANPNIMALNSAKQAANRMMTRLEAVQDDIPQEEYDRRFAKLMRSFDRVQERAQLCPHGLPKAPAPANGGPAPQPLSEPAPSLADTLNSESVKDLSWDEMADIAEVLKDDPEAAAKLSQLIDEKEAHEIQLAKQSADEQERKAAEELEAMNAIHQSYELPEEDTNEITNPTKRKERQLTRNEIAQEEYDLYVFSQYDKCASELSFMVNKEGKEKGIDDFTLFSGPASRVRKYASDELISWFAANGRHTFGSFRYSMYKWNSDRKAHENSLKQGFDNVAAW